jgi:CRISPR/Cas system-associated protein endoribonuclease Cas2
MPPEKPTGYWLITVQGKHCSGYSTRPIKQHPADYMAKHLEGEGLVFAMPITKKQYAAMRKTYAGEGE